jgi:NAD(P)-dependent dehydrogenase (short-subunit alcohol dehydrogenase family)
MVKRVLLLGGYGNFGTFIARRLCREPELTVIIAGRSEQKARALAGELNAEWTQFDIFAGLDGHLRELRPDILIHTSGPFQEQGYAVAEACIRNGVHYLDLADGREFVVNIVRLDAAARAAGVLAVSGASTVPGLTAAVLAKHAGEFETLDAIDAGIATAQKTNRGLATVRAVLGYAGKPFKTLTGGEMRDVYGWQGLHWRRFRGLGWRPLGNCDVPDLALFPQRVPGLKTVRFRGGLELPVLHLGLWSLTWLVRCGIVPNLRAAAPALSAASHLFDVFGADDSGFYMEMTGRALGGEPRRIVFDLTARAGDGLWIPCTPAIVLALKLAKGDIGERGAMPCFGLADLDDILDELRPLRIDWGVSRSDESQP